MLSLLLVTVLASSLRAQTNSYGIPEGIQEGNILHCFNWPINEVKNALPEIAAAGFGSVQLSPLQRADIKAGYAWHDLYRPYDLAFKESSGMGSAEDLKALCATAKEYGIKVIVDVVANHVDKTSGYHDTWWDSNGRVRWNGGISYDNRYSITHGQLGDYGDVNSEDSEVCARGKAYVQALKEMGVSGIRWDAAKHIGLPNEGCNFWSSVTSVSGMWHYGEILDNPGPDASIIKEYCQYMSVTDNQYSNYAARDNGGIPTGYGGSWAVNYGLGNKVVYWAESHDTYSNDEWSQNVDQSVIDRAYAAYACRNNETALYLARPNTKGYSNIKVGKGSTAFTGKHIAEVNKFRNAMVGKADYFTSTGSACSITRKDGGAVIVMKGSGDVSIANGGSYCPEGTYEDRVSGGTFTVTSTTISGTVGSSGIAVIYGEVTHDPSVTLSPNGGTFTSETQSVTATLNNATSGWYKIGDGAEQSFTGTTTFTIGSGMSVGESVTVSWGAKGEEGTTKTGSATFTKADKPNVYVRFSNTNNWNKVYVWAWDANNNDKNLNANSTWPGDELTKDADGLYTWTLPSKYEGEMPTNIIFSNENEVKAGGGDLTYQNGKTYKGDGTVIDGGDTPGGSVTITGDYNLAYSGTKENVHYWGGSSESKWPGVKMTTVTGSDGKTYKVAKVAEGTTGIVFNTNGDDNKTGDLNYTDTYVMDDNGATSTKVTFTTGTTPTKPVITASPSSGSFKESITVTLSATPAATIYYTKDGTTPSTSSSKYSSALTFTETTTLKAFGVTSDGTEGEVKTFTYTKSDGGDTPTPTPGDNLITDYYKVNPNGQVGSNRTVNMTFTKLSSDNRMCRADNALSNWTEADLIAQGVARDIAGAIKGKHEYPCVDSYAIYAAYDSENLYLGVQYVYTVWDLYGDGILTNGAAKPYNMDGRLMIAFDLDPDKSMDGVLTSGSTIWDEKGQFNTFNNGTDCIWIGSTKSTVGTPGLFFPNAEGKTSYDAPYCVSIDAPFYGCEDGLLPSITHIWGQKDFEYDPEILKTNDNFVDIINDVPQDQHTFYEFKFPLSKLGITENYIKNNGIGVMVIDTYGQGATGSTPYDPTCFDNANTPYSKDDSSSAEKEDKDVFTYAHARIGKLKSTGISNIAAGNSSANGIKVRAAGGRLYIESDKAQSVTISTVSGMTTVRKVNAGVNVIDGLAHGIYIVNRTKVVL